ncbi:MAG: hypothetical protein RBJ76_23590 [Stenomitos frigidus ULC029]
MIQTVFPPSEQAIQAFCDRWQITGLDRSVSILCDDFRLNSDFFFAIVVLKAFGSFDNI